MAAPSFAAFDQFAVGVGCNQTAGPERLSCLRAVPAATIRNLTNGVGAGLKFDFIVDKQVLSTCLTG